MKDSIFLTVVKRDVTGRAVRHDDAERIPAVIYGRKVDSQSVWVEATAFTRAFEKAGENTLIALSCDGEKDVMVLIHDYQINPILNIVTHVDFFQVRMDEEVDTDVPIVVIGESDAVKTLGGTISVADSVRVRALPNEVPHDITIDVSSLKTFEDRIYISDLNITDVVEILSDTSTSIASVTAPRTQAEVDAADDEINADVSQVEGAAEDSDEKADDSGNDASSESAEKEDNK